MIRVDKHVKQTAADEVYHIVPSLNFSTAVLAYQLKRLLCIADTTDTMERLEQWIGEAGGMCLQQ